MQINKINLFHQIKNIQNISFGNVRSVPNDLERTPKADSFVKTEETTQTKKTKAKKVKSTETDAKLGLKGLKTLQEEKLLGDEILVLLKPKTDAKGNPYFTPNQLKVINAGLDRIKFFKTLSKKLEKDATNALPQVMKDMKEIFGGENSLGQYVIARYKNGKPVSKDSISIYNKMIKSFKTDKVENEILSIFAKRLYHRDYKFLDKDEKGLVKLSLIDGDIKADSKDLKTIEKILHPDKIAYKESVDYIRDLIGIRLVLPTGSKREMELTEKYLTKAIMKGKLNVTKVSNYHSNHILPYISQDTTKMWQQMVNGLYLVESNDIRKRNGYTTTQMNIEHKVANNKTIKCELQIRTKQLNYIGQIEHLIYDILENKNISKNIPELEEYFSKIKIREAVNDVFKNDKKEQQYTDYERAMYSWVRTNETEKDKSKIYEKPELADFGLGEYEDTLSFDALAKINRKANEIKNNYNENIKSKENK